MSRYYKGAALPTRSTAEMAELSRLARSGDVTAIDALVRMVIPIAISVARKKSYARAGVDDLLQAGLLGAVRAARRWRPSGGAWSSYAYFYIHGAIWCETLNAAGVFRASRKERTLREAARQPDDTSSVAVPLPWHEHHRLRAYEDDAHESLDTAPDEVAQHRDTLERLLDVARLSRQEAESLMYYAASPGGEPLRLRPPGVRPWADTARRRSALVKLRAAAEYLNLTPTGGNK